MAQVAVAGAAEEFITLERQASVLFDPNMTVREGLIEGGPADTFHS
jgi:hypothetical protein